MSEGIDIAYRSGLPKAVIAFIPQHHGTAIMSYFYARAKEQAAAPYGGLETAEGRKAAEAVDARKYRHGGPKPQSREAAIIMLADSVEASVRSLSSRDEPAIRAMVSRIIEERIGDDQFDECNLTLRDIEQIREAFVKQLLGMYHQRVAYPQNKVVELESRRASGGKSRAAQSRPGPAAARPGQPARLERPTTRYRSRVRSEYLGEWRVDVEWRDGVHAPGAGGGAREGGRRGARRGRGPEARIDRPDPQRRRGARARSTRTTWASPARRTCCRSRCCRRRRSPITRARRRCAGSAPRFVLPPGSRLHLGDIVVSVERAIDQAAAGRGGQTGDVRWDAGDELPPAPRDPRDAARLRLGPRGAG